MFGEVVGVKGGKISRNTTNADQVMSISLAPIVRIYGSSSSTYTW